MFNVIIKNILCCFKQNKYNKINHSDYDDLDEQINIIIETNKKFNKNNELL
jgi:hypothetical protein